MIISFLSWKISYVSYNKHNDVLSTKDRIIELNLARNAKKSWQNLQLDMILDAKYKFCIIDELRDKKRSRSPI